MFASQRKEGSMFGIRLFTDGDMEPYSIDHFLAFLKLLKLIAPVDIST